MSTLITVIISVLLYIIVLLLCFSLNIYNPVALFLAWLSGYAPLMIKIIIDDDFNKYN